MTNRFNENTQSFDYEKEKRDNFNTIKTGIYIALFGVVIWWSENRYENISKKLDTIISTKQELCDHKENDLQEHIEFRQLYADLSKRIGDIENKKK